MKIYFNKAHNCFVVEECGKPLHVAATLDEAQRLMGVTEEGGELDMPSLSALPAPCDDVLEWLFE